MAIDRRAEGNQNRTSSGAIERKKERGKKKRKVFVSVRIRGSPAVSLRGASIRLWAGGDTLDESPDGRARVEGGPQNCVLDMIIRMDAAGGIVWEKEFNSERVEF